MVVFTRIKFRGFPAYPIVYRLDQSRFLVTCKKKQMFSYCRRRCKPYEGQLSNIPPSFLQLFKHQSLTNWKYLEGSYHYSWHKRCTVCMYASVSPILSGQISCPNRWLCKQDGGGTSHVTFFPKSRPALIDFEKAALKEDDRWKGQPGWTLNNCCHFWTSCLQGSSWIGSCCQLCSLS